MTYLNHLPLVAAVVFGGLTFFGVVLPAVWSAKAERRTAALDTLRELLTVVRRKR
jgi:hypothetical protein